MNPGDRPYHERPSDLRVDGRVEPIGVGIDSLSFTWRAPETLERQAGYRVQVSSSPHMELEELTWDSLWVENEASTEVLYRGRALASRVRMYWRVAVKDYEGAESRWSRPGSFEIGLVNPADWSGRWIGYSDTGDATDQSTINVPLVSPLLRKAFTVPKRAEKARLYISALGLFEASLNGHVLGEEQLCPGWRDFRHRVEYRTLDVTDFLEVGRNALGVTLADGWYSGNVGWFGRWQYGDAPLMLCQLEVMLEDGQSFRVVSDESWAAHYGGTRRSDILNGESVDATLNPGGWDQSEFDDSQWAQARSHASPGIAVVAARDQGIRIVDRIEAKTVVRADADRMIVDFGQNMAGHVAMRVDGPSGAMVEVLHAEALDNGGNLYTENLRAAQAHDSYVLAGNGTEFIEPKFTYHGFRYAEVRGLSSGIDIHHIEARAISSAVEQIGTFECSNTMLNRIHENARWSLLSNFVSIPTDCPQRDERLGWGADASVFAPTALFLADVTGTLESWLEDLADGQHSSGAYPDFAPVLNFAGYGNSGWADAGVLIPWAIWQRTGRRRVLERQFDSMVRYMEFLEADHTNGIRGGGRYGDWLGLGRTTSKDLIGTACLARVAEVFVEIAGLLGHRQEENRFSALRDLARRAFRQEFVVDDHRIPGGTQTAYAMAIKWRLIDDDVTLASAEHLNSLIESTGHLESGLLGTPLVMDALSENGHHETAYQVASSESYPSWGYEVVNGATTIWERWNSWTNEDGFADPAMNSLNHYGLGAIGDWMHSHVAGIAPIEPGYKRTLLRPGPAGDLSWARASHESTYGRHEIDWSLNGDRIEVSITIPPNTTGDVVLRSRIENVSINAQGAEVGREGVVSISDERALCRISMGPGRHLIEAPYRKNSPTDGPRDLVGEDVP